MQFSRKRIVAVVSATALALLAATVPARLLGYLLPPSIQLSGMSGTIWQGHAARAHLYTQGKVLALGQLTWSLKPWSLLLLSPSVEVDASWGQQRLKGHGRVGLAGGITLRHVEANLDARLIREFTPLYIGGTLELQLQDLSLATTQPLPLEAIEGRIVWRDGVWTAQSGDVALGNYVLEVSGTQGSVIGRVQTLSGPLVVSGQLALEQQQYNLDLALRGPATENQGLRASLRLIAVPVADGFDLQVNGRF